MVVFGLSSSREVINPCDGMENLGIGIEMAAVTRGQYIPFFEVAKVCSIKILHFAGWVKIRQRASLVLRACSEVDRDPFFGFLFGKITLVECSFWRP